MNPNETLRIVFMGTPDFAVPSLQVLADSKHQVEAVVTVPDKPQGRGQKLQPSAIKQAAITLGIPVLQPVRLKDPDFRDAITEFKPDVIVVVAFRILPESIYSIPRWGSFNLHASLLPRYRGAAPIHWALLNGDSETGVTTFFLKRKVDTGNVIRQTVVPIQADDNLHTLYEKLRQEGAGLVSETVDLIASGHFIEMEQDDSLSSPAPKVDQDTQRLDFSESNEQCANRIRAFAPKPGAFCYLGEKRIKIIRSECTDEEGMPGQVVAVDTGSFTIACATGAIRVTDLQPEGKKAMDAGAYLAGNPLHIGDQFAQVSS